MLGKLGDRMLKFPKNNAKMNLKMAKKFSYFIEI